MPSIWNQTMLVVSDVEASSRFYVEVVGLESGHGGDEYEQLLHEGEIVLQLHDEDPDDDHSALVDTDQPRGNGVLVWFEVDDVQAAAARAASFGAVVDRDIHENPNARQLELWLRDPDGYRLVLAGPSAYRPRAEA